LSDELLTAQVRLAMALPHLAIQVKTLAYSAGVTESQWEDKAHEMAMDPEMFFASGQPQESDAFAPLPG
jgi:hypothetical protein